MTNEGKRQAIHILLFIIAFLLKFLNHWQATLLLASLLFVTVIIVPKIRLKSHFYRPTENKLSQGAVMYFLVLVILTLIFPLEIVAASWAILALGDGSATLIGRHFKARELPWNSSKTYAGSAAFLIFGTLGASILLWWMIPGLAVVTIILIALKATLVAGFFESLPLKLNDNITVAVSSALALYVIL